MSGNFSDSLPKRFTQHALDVCGRKGKDWLKDLPQIIEELSANWSLKVEQSFPNLSYNYVAPCVCADGSRAVLKIGLPEEDDSVITGEANFLKFLDGNGAVKLLRFEATSRALLLERLIPGNNLAELCQKDDEQATAIAVEIMRKICRHPPSNHDFPLLENWMNGLKTASQVKFAPRLVAKAESYFKELSENSKQHLLLHGDLHHENILFAERQSFLAIDPKGVIGDIGYEIAVFMNNQRRLMWSRQDLRQILARRIEQFSQSFAIEPFKLRKWAFVQAVLSAWWVFEDTKTNSAKWTDYAEIWEEIGI